MTDHTYPEALQEIIETFRDASQEERLDMLLEYAMNLPDLPVELHNARDTMEQVHECQSPVFLLAKLLDDKVYYYIDVPREAPTVRGFASILYEGLNGAPPEAIVASSAASLTLPGPLTPDVPQGPNDLALAPRCPVPHVHSRSPGGVWSLGQGSSDQYGAH